MILTQTAICTALPSLIGIIEVNLFTMFVQFGVFLLEFSDKMELALWFFFCFFFFFLSGLLGAAATTATTAAATTINTAVTRKH